MSPILVAVLALAISMVVIPIMLRVAPALGLVDRPSARKVHSVPMARVGGWGIVLGAGVPVAMALSLEDPVVQTYLWGVGEMHAGAGCPGQPGGRIPAAPVLLRPILTRVDFSP